MKKILEKMKSMPVTAKVSVAYAACTILQKCLSIITLPLFTRLLTTEQYGQYSVYTSWSAILAIFITLNLAYGSFQTAMIKYEERRDEYIASIEGISIVFGMAFLFLYFPFRNSINQFLEMPTYLVVVMVVEMLAQSSLLFWSGKKRFEYKYKSVVAVTLAVSFMAPVIAFFLVTNTTEKGYARIMGYAFVNIAVGLFFLVFNIYRGKKVFNKEFWKFALCFNIPLIPYYTSQVIFNQSDRIMISKICGDDKAGIYSVAYTLALLLTFVLNAINSSYVPWLYESIKKKSHHENRKIACWLAVLMAVLLLGVIWVTPEVIYIMAGKSYYEAIWVVPPVAMSLLLLFYSQLFINVAFYYEQKAFLVWVSMGAALVNIVLNALLIPVFGFVAAGYTTLASYILFAVGNGVGTYKILKDKTMFWEMYNLRILFAIFVLMLLGSLVAMLLYTNLIARYALVLVVLVIAGIKHKVILDFLKRLKKKN